MPKTIKTVIVVLTILVLSAAAYNYFAFSNERKVQRTLINLREIISAPLSGEPEAIFTEETLQLFFAPEVNFFLQHGGELSRTFGRDELLRVIASIKQNSPKLTVKLDFSRRNINITEDRTATVSVLAMFENLDETLKPRRLVFTFEKNEARWQLAAVGEQ